MRTAMFLAITLAATAAAAQMPGLPGSPDPAAVTGGRYSVDPDHTLVV